MNICLQVFLLTAIFYADSIALKCNQCIATGLDVYCDKYEEKECPPDENDYCYDLYINRGMQGRLLNRGCSSHGNLAEICKKTIYGGMCIPCKRDLCNTLTNFDFALTLFYTPIFIPWDDDWNFY